MKKKTVITTEKHEVWIIRQGPDSAKPHPDQAQSPDDENRPRLLPSVPTSRHDDTPLEESDAEVGGPNLLSDRGAWVVKNEKE